MGHIYAWGNLINNESKIEWKLEEVVHNLYFKEMPCLDYKKNPTGPPGERVTVGCFGI